MPIELFESLLAEDELGLVIRSHLYIENILDEILSILIPAPKHLEDMNLGYSAKVKLICALGFDPDYKQMLLALGSYRNKFAHNIKTKIDEKLVKDLHSKVHQTLRDAFPKITQNISGQKHNKLSFNEIHPRDQFIGLVVSLWVVMNGAAEEAKKKRA